MKHLPIGIIGWEHDFNRAAQGLFAVIGEGASGAFGLHGGLRRPRVLSAMVRSAFGEAAVHP